MRRVCARARTPLRPAAQYIGFARVYGTAWFNPASVLGRFNNFAWCFVVELAGAAYLGGWWPGLR